MESSLVFLTVTLGICSGFSLSNDPCQLSPRPMPLINETATFHADKSCTEGWVHWNYPQGHLRLVFERENPELKFRVCLHKRSLHYYDRALDVTTGRVIWPDYEEPCVASDKGQVTLEFQSDKFQYYLAIISYTVE